MSLVWQAKNVVTTLPKYRDYNNLHYYTISMRNCYTNLYTWRMYNIFFVWDFIHFIIYFIFILTFQSPLFIYFRVRLHVVFFTAVSRSFLYPISLSRRLSLSRKCSFFSWPRRIMIDNGVVVVSLLSVVIWYRRHGYSDNWAWGVSG